VTRALAAFMLVAALAGCSPDPVPRTVTVWADSTALPVVLAVAPSVEAAFPGLTVRVDSVDEPDLWLSAGADRVQELVAVGRAEGPSLRLARSGLVVVGAPGAETAPSLDAALASARTVAVAAGDASGGLARRALTAAGLWDGLAGRLVLVPTTQAALDSVARRSADVAFALAADALSSTAYRVVYRLTDAEAPPAVVSGALRRGAPPEARALLDSLAAPTAYRAWAAAGFRPPR
jgi:ABC-type molybdate transport system substrate-binding protein